MLSEIKKCVDTHDIKGLRYIFVDSLDVDPTFEKYRDDYEYCKKIDGLFDEHRELSEIIPDSTRWNAQYWGQLKTDLIKNFSEKRFEHMIHVAKVIYAEKVVRLAAERKEQNDKQVQTTVEKRETEFTGKIRQEDPEIRQQRYLEERKRALEEENKRIEAEQRKQLEGSGSAEKEHTKMKAGHSSKKVMGIVLTVIIVVAVLLVIVTRIRN